jgi:phosphonate transport system substrate-binding protein
MVIRKITCLVLLICAFSLISGCEREKEKEVSLKEVDVQPTTLPEEKGLKIAISAIISPKKTFVYYKEILDYISKKMKVPVKLVLRDTYAEVNELVKDQKIHAAFVCSGAYVDGHRDFGMELLAAPKAYGEPYYYSYIIVPADSSIKEFKDLRGKIFAFTDPMSNTGKLVPTYMLAKMDETPGSFFEKHIFTYSHDKSIEAVAQKYADAAAVDSLIWDYANATDPEFTSKTRVIEKSPPYGIPPVVVSSELAPELKENLKKLFLNMHLDEKSKPILKKLHIDNFIQVEDSAYDSIREMRKWVGEQDKSKKEK